MNEGANHRGLDGGGVSTSIMSGFLDEGRVVHFLIDLAVTEGVYNIPSGVFDMTGVPPWTAQQVTIPIRLRVDTRLRRSRQLRHVVRLARRGHVTAARESLRSYVQRRGACP